MAIQQISKIFRQMMGKHIEDPANIIALTYNEAAGANKTLKAGHHLIPITAGGTKTTNATTIKAIPLGSIVAVYNTSGAAASVTFTSDITQAALAAGVVGPLGEVGIPVPANSWLYLSNYDLQYVITQANLIVFLVKDDTKITNQRPAGV